MECSRVLQNVNNNGRIMNTNYRESVGNSSYRKPRSVLVSVSLAVICIALVTGCSGESREMADKKLCAISDSDLKTLLEGLPKEKVLDKPYYKVVSIDEFKKGEYSLKAVVDFYIFRKITLKVERKYRYHKVKMMWERYFNEYVYCDNPPSTAAE